MNKDIPSLENSPISLSNETSNRNSPSKAAVSNNIGPTANGIASEHWEYLLGELVHLVGLFITQSINDLGARKAEVLFEQLIRQLEIIKRMPDHDGSILIRRTHCKIPTPQSDENYFAMLGDLIVKLSTDSKSSINDHNKKKFAHLQGALRQAFKCFSDQGIHSLHIQIPDASPAEIDQLRLALNIVARFKTAVDDASSIRFRCYGRALTFSLINDANGDPDVNLTLTAALNGLSPVNARVLIKQAEAFHTLKTSTSNATKDSQEVFSTYNQIFSVRGLRSQLIRPLVEVNNLPWLEIDAIENKGTDYASDPLSEEDSDILELPETSIVQAIDGPVSARIFKDNEESPNQLKELISKYIDLDDLKLGVALDTLMADDYGQLEPIDIGERIVSLTRLLYALDKHCQDPTVVEHIIDFFQYRLIRIKDTVFTSIIVKRQGLKIAIEGRRVVVGLLHPRLFDLITLMTENVAALRRMSVIKDIAFTFDSSNMAGLANGFGLLQKDALHILGVLRDCFSARGSFIRPTFEGRIDLMTDFGNAIFEILWCFLKETPRRQDRLDFLNALQLLMAKLRNPKRATQFLLADICQNPGNVVFTDRNAFSLANILLHRENRELYVDINRTPESVLTLRRVLNKDVRRYACWRLDADRVRMLTKLRGIHRTLEETLIIPSGQSRSFEISFLFSLEREAMIFMAIVGGLTSRIFLRELLQRYGSPESEFYKNASASVYLPDIMVHLQMVVHSLGRAGNSQDIEELKLLKDNGQALFNLDLHPAHKVKVKQLMKSIPKTIKLLQ